MTTPTNSLSHSLTHLLTHLLTEIRGEVGQIIPLSEKQLMCVEKRRLLLPPSYNRFFVWGYVDQSTRIATVEPEKVGVVTGGVATDEFFLCSC